MCTGWGAYPGACFGSVFQEQAPSCVLVGVLTRKRVSGACFRSKLPRVYRPAFKLHCMQYSYCEGLIRGPQASTICNSSTSLFYVRRAANKLLFYF